jgi:hypothetical protein
MQASDNRMTEPQIERAAVSSRPRAALLTPEPADARLQAADDQGRRPVYIRESADSPD